MPQLTATRNKPRRKANWRRTSTVEGELESRHRYLFHWTIEQTTGDERDSDSSTLATVPTSTGWHHHSK
ncbi:hypothetical protein [Streptomyces xiaopingdaonensis]|uniref:hypothetical protein n=1 Tax=Streptomyces xiaopingdaonensis TaxID=1565415 RepID=UPI0002D7F1D1|nr:hypothetical protein [Streptomyces xiaopingdaonensis]